MKQSKELVNRLLKVISAIHYIMEITRDWEELSMAEKKELLDTILMLEAVSEQLTQQYYS